MHGQCGQPFLTANHMRRSHQMVINHMREVIGRNSIRLQQYQILIIFGQFQLSLHQVIVEDLMLNISIGAKTYYIGNSCRDFGLDLLQCQISALGVFAVIAKVLLGGFLLHTHLCQLVFCTETGIRMSLLYQSLGKYMIDLLALTLIVRTVLSLFAFQCRSFIRMQTKALESFYNHTDTALNSSLLISILNSQIEYTAGLMCQPLIYQRSIEISQMHESCRTRRDSRYLCPFRQFSCRIACDHILRRLCHLGKQQLCQRFCIHSFLPPCYCFHCRP